MTDVADGKTSLRALPVVESASSSLPPGDLKIQTDYPQQQQSRVNGGPLLKNHATMIVRYPPQKHAGLFVTVPSCARLQVGACQAVVSETLCAFVLQSRQCSKSCCFDILAKSISRASSCLIRQRAKPSSYVPMRMEPVAFKMALARPPVLTR